MAKRRKKLTKRRKRSLLPIFVVSGIFILFGSFGVFHFVFAKTPEPIVPPITFVASNFGIKNKVIEFFEANDAAEMIPIIKCESRFRHYDTAGAPLKNSEGSSAVGVAQILTSMHPDAKIIDRYNRRYDAGLTVDSFDVTTIDGNMGYALVLYKMNGTRDWECSKKFRF
jgi:hypothetical protein